MTQRHPELARLAAIGTSAAIRLSLHRQRAGSLGARDLVVGCGCAEASQRLRGFPDESRGIAEAVMALLEDPKHERLMLLPRSPNDAEALWGYHRQREQGGADGS